MNLSDILTGRRSVRKFKPDHPGRDRIEELIRMAITAPSASNSQPWRFFVTDSREVIDRMAHAVDAAVDRIVRHIEADLMQTFRSYGDYFIRFKNAPVVVTAAYREIVVLSNLVNSEISPIDLESIRVMECNSGLTSTSLAIQNLMLYAHSTGIGTACMTGPLIAADDLQKILSIPDSWHIAAVIAIGFADEEPAPTKRKTAEAVLRWVPNG
jgi:nitroreductase